MSVIDQLTTIAATSANKSEAICAKKLLKFAAAAKTKPWSPVEKQAKFMNIIKAYQKEIKDANTPNDQFWRTFIGSQHHTTALADLLA